MSGGYYGRRSRSAAKPTGLDRAVAAFMKREGFNRDEKRGHVWTDGQAIYSYRMPIAWHTDTGAIVFVTNEEREKYRDGMSPTSSAHLHDVKWAIEAAQESPLVSAAREAMCLIEDAAE